MNPNESATWDDFNHRFTNYTRIQDSISVDFVEKQGEPGFKELFKILTGRALDPLSYDPAKGVTVGQIQAELILKHQRRLHEEGLWNGPCDGLASDAFARAWNADNDGIVDFWDYLNFEVERAAKEAGL